MRASRIGPPEYCVNNVPSIREQLAVLPIVMQLLSLNLEQSSFHSRGAAQPPQNARQSQHKFALDSRLRIIIRDESGLERLVIFSVLQCANDGLGCESMADGIAARCLLASVCFGPGAFKSIAAIGLDLDVSLKETKLHVLDEAGNRIWRGRCATEAAAIAAAVRRYAPTAVRICDALCHVLCNVVRL